MKLNLRIGLTLLFFGFVIGLATVSLFGNDNSVGPKPTPSTKEIKKEADQIVKKEKKRSLEFENKVRGLEKIVDDLKRQLANSKAAANNSVSKIRRLIPPKESVDRIDTSSASHCDSLAETVKLYITQNEKKDSLYDFQIETLEEIVQVKDSIIEIKENSNIGLRSLVDKSIVQQDILQSENGMLKKKVKKEKFKRKLLSVAIAIIGGIASSLILK